MNINNKVIKAISWFLLTHFLVVYVLSDYSYAARYVESRQKEISSDYIEIPAVYGKVIDRYGSGKSRDQIILIQDLHANYETQSNIKEILKHLKTNYGIRTIGVEGTAGKLDTSILSSIPDEKIKNNVLEYFMKKGFLTGPEAFAAFNDLNSLEGLENRELYEQNAKLLVSSLNNRNNFVGILEKIKQLLRTTEEEICNPNLKKFRTQYILYRQKKLDPQTFHKYLEKWAETCRTSVGQISGNYSRYIYLNKKFSGIDYKKIDKEYEMLLKDMDPSYNLKNGIFEKFKDIFRAPDELRNDMVRKISSEKKYANLRKYVECMTLSGSINTYNLIKEEDGIVKKISGYLCENDSERDYVYVADYVQLIIKFLLNQMNPMELEEFYGNSEEFMKKYEALGGKCSKELNSIDGYLVQLRPYIEEMGRFYNIAIKRDEYFTDNFFNSTGNRENNSVMVMGGFHTFGVSKNLKKQGVSYVVIKPVVTSHTEEDVNRYYSFIRGKAKLRYEDVLSLTLAPESFLPKPWFRRKVASRVLGVALRDLLKEHGYEGKGVLAKLNGKVRDYINQWQGKVELRIDGSRSIIQLEESILFNDRPVFRFNLGSEDLYMGFNKETFKPEVLNGEDRNAVSKVMFRTQAGQRLVSLSNMGLPESTDNLLKTIRDTVIAGRISPVAKISKELDKKLLDEYIEQLKKVNTDLRLIKSGSEYVLYDSKYLKEALMVSGLYHEDKALIDKDLSGYMKREVLEDENKRAVVVDGKTISKGNIEIGLPKPSSALEKELRDLNGKDISELAADVTKIKPDVKKRSIFRENAHVIYSVAGTAVAVAIAGVLGGWLAAIIAGIAGLAVTLMIQQNIIKNLLMRKSQRIHKKVTDKYEKELEEKRIKQQDKIIAKSEEIGMKYIQLMKSGKLDTAALYDLEKELYSENDLTRLAARRSFEYTYYNFTEYGNLNKEDLDLLKEIKSVLLTEKPGFTVLKSARSEKSGKRIIRAVRALLIVSGSFLLGIIHPFLSGAVDVSSDVSIETVKLQAEAVKQKVSTPVNKGKTQLEETAADVNVRNIIKAYNETIENYSGRLTKILALCINVVEGTYTKEEVEAALKAVSWKRDPLADKVFKEFTKITKESGGRFSIERKRSDKNVSCTLRFDKDGYPVIENIKNADFPWILWLLPNYAVKQITITKKIVKKGGSKILKEYYLLKMKKKWKYTPGWSEITLRKSIPQLEDKKEEKAKPSALRTDKAVDVASKDSVLIPGGLSLWKPILGNSITENNIAEKINVNKDAASLLTLLKQYDISLNQTKILIPLMENEVDRARILKNKELLKYILSLISIWEGDIDSLKTALPDIYRNLTEYKSAAVLFDAVSINRSETVTNYYKHIQSLKPVSNQNRSFQSIIHTFKSIVANKFIPEGKTDELLNGLFKSKSEKEYYAWIKDQLVPAVSEELDKWYVNNKDKTSITPPTGIASWSEAAWQDVLIRGITGIELQDRFYIPVDRRVKEINRLLDKYEINRDDMGEFLLGLAYTHNLSMFPRDLLDLIPDHYLKPVWDDEKEIMVKEKVPYNFIKEHAFRYQGFLGGPWNNSWFSDKIVEYLHEGYEVQEYEAPHIGGSILHLQPEMGHLLHYLILKKHNLNFEDIVDNNDAPVQNGEFFDRAGSVMLLKRLPYLTYPHAQEYIYHIYSLGEEAVKNNKAAAPVLESLKVVSTDQRMKTLYDKLSEGSDVLLAEMAPSEIYYLGMSVMEDDKYKSAKKEKVLLLDKKQSEYGMDKKSFQIEIDSVIGIHALTKLLKPGLHELEKSQYWPLDENERNMKISAERMSLDLLIRLSRMSYENNIPTSIQPYLILKFMEYIAPDLLQKHTGDWQPIISRIKTIDDNMVKKWINELLEEGLIAKGKSIDTDKIESVEDIFNNNRLNSVLPVTLPLLGGGILGRRRRVEGIIEKAAARELIDLIDLLLKNGGTDDIIERLKSIRKGLNDSISKRNGIVSNRTRKRILREYDLLERYSTAESKGEYEYNKTEAEASEKHTVSDSRINGLKKQILDIAASYKIDNPYDLDTIEEYNNKQRLLSTFKALAKLKQEGKVIRLVNCEVPGISYIDGVLDDGTVLAESVYMHSNSKYFKYGNFRVFVNRKVNLFTDEDNVKALSDVIGEYSKLLLIFDVSKDPSREKVVKEYIAKYMKDYNGSLELELRILKEGIAVDKQVITEYRAERPKSSIRELAERVMSFFGLDYLDNSDKNIRRISRILTSSLDRDELRRLLYFGDIHNPFIFRTTDNKEHVSISGGLEGFLWTKLEIESRYADSEILNEYDEYINFIIKLLKRHSISEKLIAWLSDIKGAPGLSYEDKKEKISQFTEILIDSARNYLRKKGKNTDLLPSDGLYGIFNIQGKSSINKNTLNRIAFLRWQKGGPAFNAARLEAGMLKKRFSGFYESAVVLFALIIPDLKLINMPEDDFHKRLFKFVLKNRKIIGDGKLEILYPYDRTSSLLGIKVKQGQNIVMAFINTGSERSIAKFDLGNGAIIYRDLKGYGFDYIALDTDGVNKLKNEYSSTVKDLHNVFFENMIEGITVESDIGNYDIHSALAFKTLVMQYRLTRHQELKDRIRSYLQHESVLIRDKEKPVLIYSLRALGLIDYYEVLHEEYEKAANDDNPETLREFVKDLKALKRIILADLRFIRDNWSKPSQGIWKDHKSEDYYSSTVSKTALLKGAGFLRSLNSGGYMGYEAAYYKIAEELDKYREHVSNDADAVPEASLIGGFLESYANGDPAAKIDSSEIMEYVRRIENSFKNYFPVNRYWKDKGMGIGRNSQSDNISVVSTLWLARYYGLLKLHYRTQPIIVTEGNVKFFENLLGKKLTGVRLNSPLKKTIASRIIKSLRDVSVGYRNFVVHHMPKDVVLHEQINGITGAPGGVEDYMPANREMVDLMSFMVRPVILYMPERKNINMVYIDELDREYNLGSLAGKYSAKYYNAAAGIIKKFSELNLSDAINGIFEESLRECWAAVKSMDFILTDIKPGSRVRLTKMLRENDAVLTGPDGKKAALNTMRVFFHESNIQSEIEEGIRRAEENLRDIVEKYESGGYIETDLGYKIDEVIIVVDVHIEKGGRYEAIKDRIKVAARTIAEEHGEKFKFLYLDEILEKTGEEYPHVLKSLIDSLDIFVNRYSSLNLQRMFSGYVYPRLVGLLLELNATLHFYLDKRGEKKEILHNGLKVYDSFDKYVTELDIILKDKGITEINECKSVRVMFPLFNINMKKAGTDAIYRYFKEQLAARITKKIADMRRINQYRLLSELLAETGVDASQGLLSEIRALNLKIKEGNISNRKVVDEIIRLRREHGLEPVDKDIYIADYNSLIEKMNPGNIRDKQVLKDVDFSHINLNTAAMDEINEYITKHSDFTKEKDLAEQIVEFRREKMLRSADDLLNRMSQKVTAGIEDLLDLNKAQAGHILNVLKDKYLTSIDDLKIAVKAKSGDEEIHEIIDSAKKEELEAILNNDYFILREALFEEAFSEKIIRKLEDYMNPWNRMFINNELGKDNEFNKVSWTFDIGKNKEFRYYTYSMRKWIEERYGIDIWFNFIRSYARVPAHSDEKPEEQISSAASALSLGKLTEIIQLFIRIIPFNELNAILKASGIKMEEKDFKDAAVLTGLLKALDSISLSAVIKKSMNLVYRKKKATVKELSNEQRIVRKKILNELSKRGIPVVIRLYKGYELIEGMDKFMLSPYISNPDGMDIFFINELLLEALYSEHGDKDYLITALVEREIALQKYLKKGLTFDEAHSKVLNLPNQKELIAFAKDTIESVFIHKEKVNPKQLKENRNKISEQKSPLSPVDVMGEHPEYGKIFDGIKLWKTLTGDRKNALVESIVNIYPDRRLKFEREILINKWRDNFEGELIDYKIELLVDNKKEVKGHVVYLINNNKTIDVLNIDTYKKDGIEGRGTFLLTAFLKHRKEEGFSKIKWEADTTTGADIFYHNVLSKITDYSTKTVKKTIFFTAYIDALSELNAEELAEQEQFLKKYLKELKSEGEIKDKTLKNKNRIRIVQADNADQQADKTDKKVIKPAPIVKKVTERIWKQTQANVAHVYEIGAYIRDCVYPKIISRELKDTLNERLSEDKKIKEISSAVGKVLLDYGMYTAKDTVNFLSAFKQADKRIIFNSLKQADVTALEKVIGKRRKKAYPQDRMFGIIARLLASRKVDTVEKTEAFMNADKAIEPSHYNELPDMEKATEMIADALRNKKKIMIFGDYDVDGIMATTIMMKTFQEILEKQGMPETDYSEYIGYHIPDRFTEGYGMKMEGVDKVVREGCDLLITVDNGVRSKKEAEYAKSLGMDVIITDHHALPEKEKDLPRSGDIPMVHPLLLENKDHPARFLAGGGVAYKLSQSLLDEFDIVRDENYLLDFFTFSAVADIMLLKGDNRILVEKGLALINSDRVTKGIAKLMEKADMKDITTGKISFYLAPMLNASGRIAHAGEAVEMLLSSDEEKVSEIAQKLVDFNIKRREIEAEMVEDVKKRLTTEFDEEQDYAVNGGRGLE